MRRELLVRVQDAYPRFGLPVTHHVLRVTRSGYRQQNELHRRLGARIRGGPFRGMSYLDAGGGSPLLPKLAGTYELEVAEVIEKVIANRPDVVVDIGSAEGYYAVGLAMRLPRSRIVAFDGRPSARFLTQRLAAKNGVEVERRGLATAAEVEDLIRQADRPFILCDIDGDELDLIVPEVIPSVGKARLLIETHDAFVPGTTATLARRLAGSHRIQRFDSRARDSTSVEALAASGFTPHEALAIVDERRPQQSWLYAVPRNEFAAR